MNLLTTTQTAQVLSITARRVRALIKDGRLAAQKVGRDWLIRQADLEEFEKRPAGRPKKGTNR